MSDPNPYHRLHPPTPSLTRGIPPSIAPSPPGLSPQIGPFYARFQPILGTQKCFHRDFRDQFSIFPKISWLGATFFQNCVANFSGGKGPFLPGGRGGWGVVSPCLSAVAVSCPAVWACGLDRPGLQAKTGGRWPGLDHYRRTLQARPGSIWPGVVGYIGDFWPCGIFSPSGPLFCPVAGFLRPCGDLSRLDLCGASGGLLAGFCGLWLVGLGLPAGLRCLFGADGVPGF